ncbi:DNA cytosine methyltransferase [Micromonospora aurantiaca]|uniref:DNA (cytosine-5-)-methyltransferase n=1 Tax=Micromonospora aurantiaca (nom. illeg.) TaxID=47850 RepID=A0A6N3K9K8_9ACTN|nr:DNA cytosine methyltransferase [Micromonospora aurantiaca]
MDLYAGAGGWDQAARQLGLTTVGLEIWHDACVTAVNAGHPRIRCDIATYPTAPFTGVRGLIASPPCQAWSTAGKRQGEQDKARVHELVNAYAAGADEPGDGWADDRSHHAAQPVRWIRDLRPEWVAMEQVPPVLDLWCHIGDVLRGWGYSVWVGVLNSADYGVPQTRQRAVLIASRVRAVFQPETTHEENPPADALFGARRPWVSMAEALGWADGMEVVSNYGTGGDSSNRGVRSASQPASTVTSKVDRAKVRWAVDRRTRSKGAGGSMYPTPLVDDDRPAPTLTANQRWVLQSRRDSPKWVAEHGERRNRELAEPAPTVTGEVHRWSVTGDEESRPITLTEAALLQSFPADYPWHGNQGSRSLQVGNAVPPGLAAAVLAVAAGVPAAARLDLAA